MEWNQEMIVQLQVLWEEGHSTAEIGRRMGVSKNAVVGKAHRLNLSARPSPIRREAGSRAAPSLAPRPSAAPAEAGAAEAARPGLQRMPPRPRRVSACCWPIGEPGTVSFRFCDAEAMQGKPYCGQHAQLAYVKVRERREDAA